jgi:hypothetical protein
MRTNKDYSLKEFVLLSDTRSDALAVFDNMEL